MRTKVRADCPVCQLAKEIKEQLGRPAARRGFTREDQVEWLRNVVGVNVTMETLNRHLNGNHDRDEV